MARSRRAYSFQPVRLCASDQNRLFYGLADTEQVLDPKDTSPTTAAHILKAFVDGGQAAGKDSANHGGGSRPRVPDFVPNLGGMYMSEEQAMQPFPDLDADTHELGLANCIYVKEVLREALRMKKHATASETTLDKVMWEAYVEHALVFVVNAMRASKPKRLTVD